MSARQARFQQRKAAAIFAEITMVDLARRLASRQEVSSMSRRFRIALGVASFGGMVMAVLTVFVVSAPNLGAATKLEIRLAETQPSTGLAEATLAHSGQKIFLHDSVVISNDDVVGARVFPSDDGTGFNVGIFFSGQGSEKIGAEAVESHVGKRMAILVNGDVMAAAILRGLVRQKALIIGGFTSAQADEIATALNGK
jgi:preprotein translocase subunit SecD